MSNHYMLFTHLANAHLFCQVTRTRDLIDLELGDVPASTSGGKRSFLAKVTLSSTLHLHSCSAIYPVCSQAFRKAQNLDAEEARVSATNANHQDWSNLGTDDVQTACAKALSAVSSLSTRAFASLTCSFPLLQAFGQQQVTATLNVRDKLADISLKDLAHGFLPAASAANKLASAQASQAKKGVTKPFIFADMKVPHPVSFMFLFLYLIDYVIL